MKYDVEAKSGVQFRLLWCALLMLRIVWIYGQPESCMLFLDLS